jgi:hypothetical protein
MKIEPDKFSPPDALWTREMPRWVFKEVWIVGQFLLSRDKILAFGERVFDIIRDDLRGDHLHLAIAGAGSFASMSKSLLARFEWRESGGKSDKRSAKYVIEPRLSRKVTPETKVLVKEEPALLLQALNPTTRPVKRVERRGENRAILIALIKRTEGVLDYADLKTEIRKSKAEKRLVTAYSSILAGVHQRLWKKGDKVMRKRASGDGATVLAEFRRAQELVGKSWRPGILLFSGVKSDKDANLSGDKFSIGNVIELFYLTRVRNGEESVSGISEIKSVDIVCKYGVGRGSFTGEDKLKHGVIHDILRRRVSVFRSIHAGQRYQFGSDLWSDFSS